MKSFIHYSDRTSWVTSTSDGTSNNGSQRGVTRCKYALPFEGRVLRSEPQADGAGWLEVEVWLAPLVDASMLARRVRECTYDRRRASRYVNFSSSFVVSVSSLCNTSCSAGSTGVPNHRVELIIDGVGGVHDGVFKSRLLGMGGLSNEDIKMSLYAMQGLCCNTGGAFYEKMIGRKTTCKPCMLLVATPDRVCSSPIEHDIRLLAAYQEIARF